MPVLTGIDVLGIQRYVFASNRLRDVLAASWMVDHVMRREPDSLSQWGMTNDRILLAAGGNAIVEFENLEDARTWTGQCTRWLQDKAPGLDVVVAHRPYAGRLLAWGLKALAVDLARAKLERRPSAPQLGLSVTAACSVMGLPATALDRHDHIPISRHIETLRRDDVQRRTKERWDGYLPERLDQARGWRAPQKGGQEQRDDQNRSILGWVKPRAEFSFELHVQNLSAVDLGALVWLLDLPNDCFFRFGGGKPLGFGCVRLQIESCDLRTGVGLRGRYAAWHEESPPNDPRADAVDAFRNALVRAYPPASGGFNHVSFIAAFLTASRGYGDNLPVHYPRATSDGQAGPPRPDGESFKWFVANERDGARHALADLASDAGLPTLQERPRGGAGREPAQGGRRRHQRGGGERRG